MASAAHLFLKANGVDVHGDSTVTSLDRAESIECLTFEDKVATQREASAGVATGRRLYDPVVIRKRFDRSTPLLAKALCYNENIEATFKFYRPAPSGDGSTEHFLTVLLTDARISCIERELRYVLDPKFATDPPMEKVSFVFSTIRVTYEPTGAEHEDEWRETA